MREEQLMDLWKNRTRQTIHKSQQLNQPHLTAYLLMEIQPLQCIVEKILQETVGREVVQDSFGMIGTQTMGIGVRWVAALGRVKITGQV
jgi:hypothetical protein